MPELSSVKSPLSRPSNIVPDFNFGDRAIQPLGELDTWLSRVTGTNYDKGFNPYKNQQDNRFENTSWLTATANNLGALTSKTANGVIQAAGGITSLIASPIAAFSDDISFTDMFSKNPLNTLADGIDTHINELFPRVQASDFNSKGFLQQLARPGELLSANIDSLAFLAQSFVGAGLLSKLNVGGKLAAKLSKVNPAYKYLDEIAGPNSAALADKINFFTTNEVLTFNESAMEAKDAVETLKTTLRQKRDLGEVNYTDEEIEAKANQAGINTFWLNAITLSVTNGAFTKLVSPTTAKATNKLNPYDLRFLDKEFKAPVYSSKFERFLSDKGYVPGAVSKALVENTISEGLEESMQYSIQQLNSKDGISFEDAKNKYISDFFTGEIFNMSDPERAKAAGLGALIGGLGVGGSTLAGAKFKNIGPINEARDFKTAQTASIKELNDSYAGFTSLNRFKDQEGKLFVTDGKFVHEVAGTPKTISKEEFTALATEKGVDPTKGGSYSIPGQLSFDDEGNPNISPEAIHDLVKDTKVMGELDDLVEKELASANPNATKLRLYKMERLKTAAIAAHNAGVMDIFQEQLDTLSKDSVIGLNSDIPIQDELDLAKDYTSRLNTALLTIDNSLIDKNAKKVAYDKAGRIISLDYAGQVETAKNQMLAENLTPEQQALGYTLSKQLSILDDVDQNYTAYSQEARQNFNKSLSELNIGEIANAPSKVKDYARSITNLDYIIKSREELGRTLDTILAGGKETKTPFEENGLPFRAPKTAKEYEYYEGRVAKKYGYDNKVEDIMSQYNSGLFNELESYLNIADPVEGASELSNFVKSSIDRGIVFSDDVKDSISNKVSALKGEVANLEELVRGPIEAEGYTLENMFPEAADAVLDESVADSFRLLTELKSALAPLDNFSPDQFATREIKSITPKYILEKLMEPATNLIESAYIDDEINPTFTDEASIDVEIEKLQAINDNVLPTRDDLKGLGLPQLLKSLVKLKGDYQDLKKDREAKNARQDVMYANFVLDASRDSTIAPTLSEEDRVLIDEVAKEDPVTAALIASDRVSDKEVVRLRQEVLDKELMALLERLGVRNANGLINMMKRNPIRGLSGIISRLQFINSIAGSSVGAFTQFTIDYDLVNLMEADVSEDYKALRDIFGKYFGLWEITTAQNSDLTTKQALLNYQKFLNAKPITPTSAQFRTSLQIARILNAPKESTEGRVQVYQNITLLKAPAGAGKTSVVLPLATQLSGLGAGSVYTAAPYEPGAKAIATSTGTKARTVTELVQDLKNDRIQEDVKVIVVDEITTLSYDALHALAGAFTAFLNRNQERSIKMVGMYDPLQVNESDNGVPVLDREFFSQGSGYDSASEAEKKLMREGQSDVRGTLPFIHNVTDVSPLATTFRSNVAAVIDLQNLFKGTAKVSNPSTTASSNPNNTTKDILGTYSGSSTEIIKILKSSYATNNGATTRSRVIITDDVNKWQPILDQQGIVGVDVITVEQSSGITRDEVYINIKIENKPSFNRRMYTAISRASKFVYLGNYPTNFTEDASIPDKVRKAEEINTSRNDSTKELVEAQLRHFGVETTVNTPMEETESPEETEVETELPLDIEDTPSTSTSTNEPVISIPDLPEADGTHELSFPSSTAFNTYGTLGPLKAGDDVLIARDNSNNKNRYLVLQPNPTNEDYRVVGILSDEEVPRAEAALGLVGKLDKLVPYTFIEEQTDLAHKNTFMRVKGNVALDSSYRLQVSGNSVDMQFHYDNVPTNLSLSSARAIVVKVLSDMYPGFTGLSNISDFMNNVHTHINYRVFSSEKGAKKALQLDNVDGLLNKPLMIISGVQLENGKELRPIYIHLNSQILNDKNDRAVDLVPMREFISKVGDFEKMIKTITNFPSAIYGQFNSEFSFKLGDSNIYFPFHKFVRAIAHPSEKTGLAEIASKELNAKLKKAGQPELLPIDVKTLDPAFVKLAKEIDKLIHGGGVFKGEAQQAMDKLATANFLVELPNGATRVLRDYKAQGNAVMKDGKLQHSSVLTAPTLLGPVTFEHNGGKSKNALIPALLIEKMTSYLKKAYDKHTGEQSLVSELPFKVKESTMPRRYKMLADMLIQKDTAHLFPLTLDDLDQLINKGVDKAGNFTNINEGFGLRTPISRKDFGKSAEGVQVIEGLFETTFQGVTRTRIGVTFNGGNIGRDAEITKTEKIPNPYTPFYREVDAAKSLEEALKLAPKFAGLEFSVPIEEAITLRYDAVNKAATYTTVSRNIRDVLNTVRHKSKDLKTRLVDSLISSPTAISFGKYAARDFIRATIYAEMMPEIYNTTPFVVIDLARMWVEQKYDTISERIAPFADKAMELQKVYAQIFEEAGIPFTTSTNPVEFVENVVAASSLFRAKQKEGFRLETATDAQVDSFETFLKALDDATSEGEAFLSKFIDLNQENFARFAELVNLSKEDQTPSKIMFAIDEVRTLPSIERSMRRTDGAEIGELITEEGAIEVYNSFFNAKTLANLFTKKGTEAFNIITEAYMQHQLGKENWGLFKDGVVYVTKDSANKVGSKVVRHEAFHKVFWNYLTKEEQIRALALAEDRYGKHTKLELEERLADDFAGYQRSEGVWSAIKSIFRKIARFFNFSYNNLTSLESLFNSINEGYYATRKPNEVNVERDLKIAKYWGSIDMFTTAKSLFLDTFVRLQNESRNTEDNPNASFRTFDSTIEETFEILKKWHAGGDIPLEGDAEYIRKSIAPLVSNPKAYAEFIDQYFSNANAKAAKRQKLSELDLEKTALQETLSALDKELAALDTSSEEFSSKSEELDETNEAYESLLAAELFESELRDPQEKLTGMVKARLIGIKYSDEGKIVYAPLSKSYGALLNFVSQADTSSLDNLLTSLQDRVKYYFDANSTKTKGVYNTIRKSAASYLVKLIQDIRENKAPKNLNFFRDVSSVNEYAIFGKNGEDTSNITHTEALRFPNKYIKVERELNDSAMVFAGRIITETGMSMADIKQAYRLFEDVNFIRSLTAAAVSMVKAKPYVGSSRWDFYNWINRYSQVGRSGQTAAVESRFVERFADAAQKSSVGTPFNVDFMDTMANAKTPETKLLVFQKLFRNIGMGMVSSQLSNSQVEDAFTRLKNAVPDINRALANGNPYEVIDNQGSLISAVVELFENSASLIEIDSHLRGDGKKAYGWRDASSQSSLLNYFDKNLSGKTQKTGVPNHVKVVEVNGKKVITTTSPFLKSNPFVTGKNKLRSFVDHDSLKKLGNTSNATFLYGEKLSDYHSRNFAFGFLNRLRSSRDGYYFQFLPVPANRTSMQAVEVGAMQINVAKQALIDMINAERNRPNLPELANNKNFQKNKDKFFIPGLQGLTTTKETTDALLKKVDAHIAIEVETVVKEMMGLTGSRKIDIDPADISHGLKQFNIKIDKYKPSSEFKKEISALIKNKAEQSLIDKAQKEAVEMETKSLTALVTAFYYNSIVNQYSLSQMIYGDNVFYKNKEDLTKRIQVFTATGDTLLIDDRFGLPKTTRIAVMKDVVRTIPKDMEGVRADSYRETLDETDAEGYMTPEFYERLARTQGIESGTDVVMKLVYASVDANGVPSAVKYSVKVLTDQLVKQYPHLKALREQMRKEDIQQATFVSAVKVSTPQDAAEMTNNGIFFNGKLGFGDSVMVLDSKDLRSQLNPAKSIETSVANPSQVTSMINTNGLNTTEAEALYNLNSLVMELGGKILSRELRLSEKGGLTKASKDALVRRLIKITDGVANGQDINYLLSYVSPEGDRVSMNLPIIQQKVLATIASMFSTATTAFRFSGSKMVLQSEFGTYSAVASALQYKDAEGYTEVLLPAAYKALFKEGDVIGGKNAMMGFRIPSTNYHSALAMRVKGFYETPVGAESNVIIAPSMIVYYHGSDFDLDCLFIIKKETNNEETINLNSILEQYGLLDRTSDSLIVPKGSYFGFMEEEAVQIDGLSLHEYLFGKISELEDEITYRRSRLANTQAKTEKAVILDQLTAMEKDYYTLIDVATSSAKNAIVDLFSKNIADPKNRTDLLTPIYTRRVSSVKTKNVNDFYKDLAKDETLIKDLVEAGIITVQC